jgi:hypothetical protein
MADLIHPQLITPMQALAKTGAKPADVLRFLAIENNIHDQVELMSLFAQAFNSSMGNVTPIVGWWFEGEHELDDEAINDYIGYVIEDYLK